MICAFIAFVAAIHRFGVNEKELAPEPVAKLLKRHEEV
jgi:hypothetical protein